jgi:hypothetical protein
MDTQLLIVAGLVAAALLAIIVSRVGGRLPGLHMPVRIRGAYRVVIDTPPFDLSGQS